MKLRQKTTRKVLIILTILSSFLLGIFWQWKSNVVCKFTSCNAITSMSPDTPLSVYKQQLDKITINIPAVYFDPYRVDNLSGDPRDRKILRGLFIQGLPKTVSKNDYPEFFKNTNEPFKLPPTDHPEEMLPMQPEYKYEYFDVTNDGQNEKIVSIPYLKADGQAYDIWIVKDNVVIFKTGVNWNFSIEESKSHNGFYIHEFSVTGVTGINGTPNEETTIRFVYGENGQFAPVWKQTSMEMLTTE